MRKQGPTSSPRSRPSRNSATWQRVSSRSDGGDTVAKIAPGRGKRRTCWWGSELWVGRAGIRIEPLSARRISGDYSLFSPLLGHPLLADRAEFANTASANPPHDENDHHDDE